MLGFAEVVDAAIMVYHNPLYILQRDLPRPILMDSSSLFSVVVKETTKTEKRLIIDFRTAGESFQGRDIDEIGRIQRNQNLSEGPT